MKLNRIGTAALMAAAATVLLVGIGGGATEAQAQLSPADLKEGTHYRLIQPAQPTSSEADQVEVAEIFQYSCTHCFSFEPHLEQWKAQKADYVNFVRLPASWNPLAKTHAQAFYTAEVLGKVEEMHQAFFREIHVERNLLQSEAELAEFFGRYGVDEDTFKKTFNSFAVHTKVQRADELIRRYRVGATPNIVVNGKYLTDGSMGGSYEAWFDIVDALAVKEHEGS